MTDFQGKFLFPFQESVGKKLHHLVKSQLSIGIRAQPFGVVGAWTR